VEIVTIVILLHNWLLKVCNRDHHHGQEEAGQGGKEADVDHSVAIADTVVDESTMSVKVQHALVTLVTVATLTSLK
jgi:hypothetical protein